ncbi:hypothetical protein A3SI_14109 [Nitritalea halalkaliphila LW7]|uniref:DUF4843 domain-containing protein n=1 Tax=Nitritalea halalkaliphila LW7 TaxID=1189621 RepID=I5BZW3_9BACT|nr:DUF4843 domain-containing protein [Nitritalea halalkaliphila]EIM75115.1 hypothetical protein A3SI_14109 [Nitritalea halalkaliphila LW7]
MKTLQKQATFLFAFLMSFLLTGCFEDIDQRFLFTTLTVEFDDSVGRTTAPGLDFPIVGTLRNNAGVRQYRVNLFGGLHDQDIEIEARIVESATTAQEGVHFNLPQGRMVRIPAGEAFGFVTVEIPELTNTQAVRLVFELQPTEEVRASANNRRIGIDIRR